MRAISFTLTMSPKVCLLRAHRRSGGERYFLNELEPVSWRNCTMILRPARDPVGLCRRLPGAVSPFLNPSPTPSGLAAHAKVLLSVISEKRLPNASLWMDERNRWRGFPQSARGTSAEIRERVKCPIRIQQSSSVHDSTNPWSKFKPGAFIIHRLTPSSVWAGDPCSLMSKGSTPPSRG